ncbi:hypothetical protein E2C01_005942 [Portunus trituberculatus]|uniref:Uncharacterized protein n=1 Tax=Portunus trituberculatus TaxID=210409 RepID=A0A5B7CVL2_PORTR|nr:hypothetical protein [Portunus trituberculatus]
MSCNKLFIVACVLVAFVGGKGDVQQYVSYMEMCGASVEGSTGKVGMGSEGEPIIMMLEKTISDTDDTDKTKSTHALEDALLCWQSLFSFLNQIHEKHLARFFQSMNISSKLGICIMFLAAFSKFPFKMCTKVRH